MFSGRSAVSFAILSVLLAGSLTACSQRSPEAFCSTMEEHKNRYLKAWDQASEQGALGGLIGGTAAVGDLKIMWDELAEVAPEDIRSDAESVRDAWKQQEEAAKSGDWMGALAGGLLNSGSMSRVDQYVRENCDGQTALAAGQSDVSANDAEEPKGATHDAPASTPTPTPTEPSGIVNLDGGSWEVVSGVLMASSGMSSNIAQGIDGATEFYVPDEGLVEVDAGQLLSGEEVVSQRWTIAGEQENPYAVGKVEVRQPARGLDPETYRTRLLAVELAPGGARIEHDTEIQSSPCTSNSGLIGSTTDAVAFELSDYQDELTCTDDSTTIVAWDPQAGKELWTEQAEMESWSHGVVTATYPDPEGESWDRCLIVSGLDVATGDPLWGVDERNHKAEDYCPGAVVDPDVGGGFSAHFATKISVNGDNGFTKRVETRTGRELNIPTNLAYHDPVSGLGVIIGDDAYADEDVPPGLTVLDPFTGESVYTMDPQRFESLGLEIKSFYDGRLYARDGYREIVLDAKTGDVVLERQQDDRPAALTEFVYPVARAGTHVLFNNHVLVTADDADSYMRNGTAAENGADSSSAS